MPSPMKGFDAERELYIEPIYGLRVFGASYGSLKAIHHDYLWLPDLNIRYCMAKRVKAVADVSWEDEFNSATAEGLEDLNVRRVKYVEEILGFARHDMKSCSCGFYAYHSHRHLSQFDMRFIPGIVEATGEVLLGDRGFRAEKAKIVAIASPLDPKYEINPDYVKWIANTYGAAYYPSLRVMMGDFPPTYLDKFPDAEYGRH